MHISEFVDSKAWRGVTALIFLLPVVVLAAPGRFTADLVRSDSYRVDKFEELIAGVQRSDADARARFAEIALDTIIRAYVSELDRLEDKSGAVADGSWDLGTRRYVEHLKVIAASIAPVDALQIIHEPHGAVRLVIGQEQVMLNAPRAAEQTELERDIVENACVFIDCETRGDTVEKKVMTRSAALSHAWVLEHEGPPRYASSDGLQCVFRDKRHLKLKTRACNALMFEIRLLLETVAALKVHGKLIDWRHIEIAHVAPGKPQKVTYNASGGFVRLQVPSLLRADAVWRGAIPWIMANLSGRATQHVINLPDQLVYLTSSFES